MVAKQMVVDRHDPDGWPYIRWLQNMSNVDCGTKFGKTVYLTLLDNAKVFAKWSIEKKKVVFRGILPKYLLLIVNPRWVLHVFNVLLSCLCK